MKLYYQLSAAIIGAAVVTIQPPIVIPPTLDEQAISAIAKNITVVINGQNYGYGVIISKQGNTYSVH